MGYHSPLVAALTTASIVAGCATATPYNPFKITEEEFHAKIKTIALLPLGFPGDLGYPGDPGPVKAKFESLIEAKLREGGFSVVPSRDTADTFERMSKQLGGVFDPVSGKRDEQKSKTALEQARRELGEKFKADAVLRSTIIPGTAAFTSGTAKWNGTTESMAMREGFWGAFQANNFRGNAGALSLLIVIENIQGGEAYLNVGGIQLITKLSGGQLVPVPRKLLFTDEGRNAAAVNIALDPLIRNPAPAGAAKP